MGCPKCAEAQEKDSFYYYRWKNANIEMRGCAKHIGEVFKQLSIEKNGTKKTAV